jgi:hypothetical protein
MLSWIRLQGRTPESWTQRQPESYWRRWRPRGRCTGYGRSSCPLRPRCLSTLEKPVTQKRSSHACLIIEILASIQNSSFIDLRVVDVWGRWITRCGGMRKWWRQWRTVWSVPLLQEVIKYAVKQYLYKIGKFAYLKIFTCIIEMM